jgi:hypothetical protein
MGKKSSKMPAAPDPAATAAAQTAANKEAIEASARYNQVNQQTPYGRVYYTGEIGSPNRTQVTELSPAEQQQLNLQNQSAESLMTLGRNRAQTLGADLGNMNQDYSADMRRLEDATFNQGLSRLNPQFEQQQRQMETSLANRGIPLGSEAYNNATQQFNQSRNDALSSLANQSIGLGRQEQSRLFGQDLQRRGTLINEVSALMQGQGAIQTPQAQAQAQYNMNPVDMAGLMGQQYQSQMNQYNQAQQQRNSTMGGLFGLAGAALPLAFCSRDFKTDHEAVNENQILDNVVKLPVAKWTYTIQGQPEGPHIGPYAEDFQELFGVGDGKTIALVDMFGVMLASIKALHGRVRELEAR